MNMIEKSKGPSGKDTIFIMLTVLSGFASSNDAQISDRSLFPAICSLREARRAIEPLSCWCISKPKEHLCHVINPDLHLPQDVKERCGTDTFCCLEQVTVISGDISLHTTENVTSTANNLSSFARFITDLFALCNDTEKNNVTEIHNTLVHEHSKGDTIPSYTLSSAVSASNGLGVAESKNKFPFLIGNDVEFQDDFSETEFSVEAGNESSPVQETLLGFKQLYKENESSAGLNLQDIASSLLTQTRHLSKRSLNDTNLWLKAFTLMVGFINNTISNRIQNANATTSGIDKNDLVDDYNKLGWLAKAVEAAFDISLYAGVALGIMYLTGTLLSGFISSVWSTCFICYFAKNFDLVPVSPGL